MPAAVYAKMAMAAARPPMRRPLWMNRLWPAEVLTEAGAVEAAAVAGGRTTTTVEDTTVPAPEPVGMTVELDLLKYEVGQATVLELETGQWAVVVVLWRLAGQLVIDGLQRVMVMVWVMEMVDVVVPEMAVEMSLPAATRVTTKARTVR